MSHGWVGPTSQPGIFPLQSTHVIFSIHFLFFFLSLSPHHSINDHSLITFKIFIPLFLLTHMHKTKPNTNFLEFQPYVRVKIRISDLFSWWYMFWMEQSYSSWLRRRLSETQVGYKEGCLINYKLLIRDSDKPYKLIDFVLAMVYWTLEIVLWIGDLTKYIGSWSSRVCLKFWNFLSLRVY